MRVLQLMQNPHSPIIICPFCKESLSNSVQVKQCEACLAPHHVECWKEYGRCTVFGCTGRRSVEILNFRLMFPSLILMGSTLNHLTAVVLSPLLVPAFLMLMNEVIKFVQILLDRGIFTGSQNKQEAFRNFIYLLINQFLFTNGSIPHLRFNR